MKYTILVVDDDENIRDMLSRHFRLLGYRVSTAENGWEALKIMENNKCDVVISDVSMPVMDGVQLLREVRQQYPMVRCIMMTGYVTMENILSCMRHGADTCIFKPFKELTELEEAVKNAMNFLQHWENKLKVLLEMKP
jgi:DNA-binding NtrC family response regulator